MRRYKYNVKLTIKFPHEPKKGAIRRALRSIVETFTDALCNESEAEDYQHVPDAKLKLEKS